MEKKGLAVTVAGLNVQVTDTPTSQMPSTASTPAPASSTDLKAIIGAVVGVVALGFLSGLILILRRKRGKVMDSPDKKPEYKPQPMSSQLSQPAGAESRKPFRGLEDGVWERRQEPQMMLEPVQSDACGIHSPVSTPLLLCWCCL